MTDQFIMKFSRMMDWTLLSKNYDFSIDMLRMYQHRVIWAYVLKRQVFPEDFLREMAKHFDECWPTVSRYQSLSESFIHDYASKVDWEDVIMYQHVSGRLLRDHYEYYTPEDQRLITPVNNPK